MRGAFASIIIVRETPDINLRLSHVHSYVCTHTDINTHVYTQCGSCISFGLIKLIMHKCCNYPDWFLTYQCVVAAVNGLASLDLHRFPCLKWCKSRSFHARWKVLPFSEPVGDCYYHWRESRHFSSLLTLFVLVKW